MTVSQNDILEAIRAFLAQQPQSDGESGITAKEYAEAQGVSILEARKQLGVLIRAGHLEAVQVRRKCYDGIKYSTQTGFRPK